VVLRVDQAAMAPRRSHKPAGERDHVIIDAAPSALDIGLAA
jgi:hypothetical protein